MALPGHMWLQIDGAEIRGGCEMAGREDSILVQGFSHEIDIPHDPQTGLSTGKRIHGAFSILKDIDRSSPLVYDALCHGKHCELTVKWYRISETGHETHFFTHELERAIVVTVEPQIRDCLDEVQSSFPPLEKINFTYERITWTWEDGGITAQDNWLSPA